MILGLISRKSLYSQDFVNETLDICNIGKQQHNLYKYNTVSFLNALVQIFLQIIILLYCIT